MKNSSILKTIGLVMAVIGAIASVVGIYLRNEADSMLSALNAGSSLFGYSSSTYRSMSIWDEHLQKGNIVLIIGIILVVVGAVIFVVGYLKGNERKHPEQASTAPLGNSADTANIAEKLKELDELKDQGILSEEEYSAKRQEIIARF